jgi:F420-non-reducing hydrogenase iron-sulfur subunit
MFEPRIVCFFCRWCTYAGADLAGTSRKQYPPNGVVVRVNCSGRVDPQHILWAFREGADGVLIGGCHPHDCHYQDGNYKTMRRVALMKPLLEQMGIAPERLRLEWISAAEGEKLVHVMSDFVSTVAKLGPLNYGPIAERVGGLREVPKLTARAAGKAPAKRARKPVRRVAPKRAARTKPPRARSTATKSSARKAAPQASRVRKARKRKR